MTEENYNYRTSQTLLRKPVPGEREVENSGDTEISTQRW